MPFFGRLQLITLFVADADRMVVMHYEHVTDTWSCCLSQLNEINTIQSALCIPERSTSSDFPATGDFQGLLFHLFS